MVICRTRAAPAFRRAFTNRNARPQLSRERFRRGRISQLVIRQAKVSSMAQPQLNSQPRAAEAELVRRAVSKDEAAIRAIIQANNRRLYRVARSIVRDDSEAEDVVQEAYLRAFSALPEFRGELSLATWLTRIVFNEALQRRRRRVEQPVGPTRSASRARSQVIPFPFAGQQSRGPRARDCPTRNLPADRARHR